MSARFPEQETASKDAAHTRNAEEQEATEALAELEMDVLTHAGRNCAGTGRGRP
ncbi:hypothetical protein GTY41_19600 [Streptomyces sp. SID685]|uniref:hypothetical protein n=1 Tax=Streptomyces TaxID=1883 RepID=UPI0013684186|nr:hypothetical protein [Streptomyces sp. SID685]MYR87093.1 hypothetical protein [Streptomyces sp. SID685]